MDSILSKISRSVLDLLLPVSCEACGKEGRFLCVGCEASLSRLGQPYCSICADPEASGLCESCVTLPPPIDGIRAPYLMNGAIKNLIYSLKYRHVRAAAPDLARLLANYIESNPMPADLLVPVPLHSRRERERGYNQSELLARELSKLTRMAVETNILVRVKHTSPQVEMESQEDRRRNIEDAFECSSNLSGKRVLLIDDVVTTGSTMFTCAKALKAAGAGAVWGLALARQAQSRDERD